MPSQNAGSVAGCRRRTKFEPPCRLNIAPGLNAFRVQSVGCVEAQVILSSASRLAAHRKRSATRLRWDSASNDLEICDRLFAGMRGSMQMVATVRSVFKCAGGGAELLLVDLVGGSV